MKASSTRRKVSKCSHLLASSSTLERGIRLPVGLFGLQRKMHFASFREESVTFNSPKGPRSVLWMMAPNSRDWFSYSPKVGKGMMATSPSHSVVSEKSLIISDDPLAGTIFSGSTSTKDAAAFRNSVYLLSG